MGKNTNGTKELPNEKSQEVPEVSEVEESQSSQESLSEGSTLTEPDEDKPCPSTQISKKTESSDTNTEKEILESIAPDKLVPFEGHPFKLYEGERFTKMVESVRTGGIIEPVIVRPLKKENGKYEILSGHNRVAAAKEAGLAKISIIIRTDLTDEAALFIVMETNLIQQSFADLKHSERAITVATLYEAMKKDPGYRSDLFQEVEELTSAPVGRRLGTRDKLGQQYGLSKNTIARYLRVNKLITALKDRLDKDAIGMRVADALSFLQEEEQEIVEGLLAKGKKISIKQANTLKEKSINGGLSKTSINEIFNPGYFGVKIKPVKLSGQFLSQHFKLGQSVEEIEKIIAEALERYFSNHR
jgi:ParB family chromosome partitioning protein